MTVSELIEYLKTFPADMPVAAKMYSEQFMISADEISVEELCFPREDGWVQNKRPDMPCRKYLVFPGN